MKTVNHLIESPISRSRPQVPHWLFRSQSDIPDMVQLQGEALEEDIAAKIQLFQFALVFNCRRLTLTYATSVSIHVKKVCRRRDSNCRGQYYQTTFSRNYGTQLFREESVTIYG
jgi:hypothetical protein